AGVKAGHDELWLVGPPRLAQLAGAAGASLCAMEEPVELQRRTLAVEVRRRAAAPARVQLELPGSRLCARLLRDPFGTAQAAPARIAAPAGTALLFSASGRRIL